MSAREKEEQGTLWAVLLHLLGWETWSLPVIPTRSSSPDFVFRVAPSIHGMSGSFHLVLGNSPGGMLWLALGKQVSLFSVEPLLWEPSGDPREHSSSPRNGWYDHNHRCESQSRAWGQWDKNSKFAWLDILLGVDPGLLCTVEGRDAVVTPFSHHLLCFLPFFLKHLEAGEIK